jgi:hypothetical protein
LALCPEQEVPQQPWFKLKQKNRPTKISAAAKATATSFKYCLLHCAEAIVINPARDAAKPGTIFVDSGSQVSLITERMAKALKLNKFGTDKYQIRGVGPAKKNTKSYSEAVKIELKTSKGPLEMELLVVPTSHLPPLVTVKMSSEEKAEFESNPLRMKHRIEIPDVLIGANYLQELDIQKERRLPSGFWLSNSSLGPLFDGEGELANVAANVTKLPRLNSTLIEVAAQSQRISNRQQMQRQPEKTASALDGSNEKIGKCTAIVPASADQMPKKQIAVRPLVKRAEVKEVVELKTPERALTAKAALEMGGQAVNGRKQNSGNGAKKRRRQKARQWARHSPDGSNRGLLAVSRNAQNGLEGKRG